MKEGIFEQSPYPHPLQWFKKYRVFNDPFIQVSRQLTIKALLFAQGLRGGQIRRSVKSSPHSLLVIYPWIWRVIQGDEADKRSNAILGCINREKNGIQFTEDNKLPALSTTRPTPGELLLILGVLLKTESISLTSMWRGQWVMNPILHKQWLKELWLFSGKKRHQHRNKPSCI